MALNSRGRFIPAPDAQSLVDAFKGILDEIVTENLKRVVSIAVSRNTGTATSERRESRASPQTPWPLVQPPPRRAP